MASAHEPVPFDLSSIQPIHSESSLPHRPLGESVSGCCSQSWRSLVSRGFGGGNNSLFGWILHGSAEFRSLRGRVSNRSIRLPTRTNLCECSRASRFLAG